MVASLDLILLLSSTIGATLAAPVLESRGTFSISAAHNGKFVRNGPAALLKTYAKYNLKPTSTLPKVLSTHQGGSVSAAPAPEDVEYLCPVTIGGQTLNLDFDTGSADLWVFSDALPPNSRKGHTVFSPSKSPTFQPLLNASWEISYGDGSGALGTVGNDTVTIGGTTVKQQGVELATAVSSQFISDTSDGLVGLAFNSINQAKPKQQTFMDNAKSFLHNPLFAAYLPFGADGAYDFGDIDSTHYSGEILSTDVDASNGFWEFASNSYSVGNQTFNTSGVVAIADTGTTLLLMGDSAVSKYYSFVEGAVVDDDLGGWIFPCNATLPELSVAIGDAPKEAIIPSELLNFAPIDLLGRTCFGSLQSTGMEGFNIYGDIFFNAYYSIFDLSGPSFKFAPIASIASP